MRGKVLAAIRRGLMAAVLAVSALAIFPGVAGAAPCYLRSALCGEVVVLGRCGGTGAFQVDCLADPPRLVCDVACQCIGELGEALAGDVCPALTLEVPTLSPAGASALGLGLAGLALLKLRARRRATGR